MSRPVSRRAFAVTFALALWVDLAAEAHADDDVTRIEYRAPTECPNAANFIAEVSARTHRAHLSDAATNADPATSTITVAVAADGAAFRGTLRIARAETVTSERAVTGDTCVEVVSALALIAALELDPGASTAALPAAVATTTPSAPPPATSTAPPPSATPFVLDPTLPARAPASLATPPRTTSGRERVRFSAGIEGDAIVGLVPSALLGGGAFAEAFAPWRGAPSIRLSAFAAAAHPTFTGSIGARVQFALARLDVCPLALGGRPIELRFCATLDGGVIMTRGSGVDVPQSVAKPWFAPGLRSRVSWTTPSGIFAELGGGLTVPLVRYPFDYDEGTNPPLRAYRVSPIGAAVTVSAGYHFP